MAREHRQKKGGNLVAWEIVQQPKNKVGLGVINLRFQNDALLLKHLHKFYNKMEIPWIQQIWFRYYQNKIPHASREVVSFWWKDILRLHSIYSGIAHCAFGNGATCCFWSDPWLANIFESKFPRIASFAKDNLISVRGVLQAEDLDDLFLLPLYLQATEQLDNMLTKIQSISFNDEEEDSWLTIWRGDYSPKKFYSHI
jgi:hypothetical protein